MNQLVIQPFWQRIPAIFAYGFHGTNLAVAGIYSVLVAIAAQLPFAIVWIVMLWMGAYKYCYEILVTTAMGQLRPPDVSLRVTDDWMAWKQLGVIIFMITVSVSAWRFLDPIIGVILAGFFLLALPATIMTIAMTRSVVEALNPFMTISVMSRIGVRYLLLVVFELLLVLSSVTLQTFLGPVFPDMFGQVILQFLDYLFLFMMFHLIGYVMHQYHEELGLDQDEKISRPGGQEVKDPQLERLQSMIKGGHADQAREELGRQLKMQGGTPAEHELYRKLLRLAEDNAGLLAHGRSFVSVLLALEDPAHAMKVAAECLRLDKRFGLDQPAQVRILAEQAMRVGQSQLTLALTAGFAKKYPKHKDNVANYLMAARILSERMNQDDKAIAILRRLVSTYPDHADIGQAQELLDALLRMQGPA